MARLARSERRRFLFIAGGLAAFAQHARVLAAPQEKETDGGGGGGGGDTTTTGGGTTSLESLERAEELVGIRFTPAEREQVLRTLGQQRDLIDARRSRGWIPNQVAPATIFSPQLPGTTIERATDVGDPSTLPADAPPMPRDEEEIAFAPAWTQACWIRDGATTSAELTDLALRRLDDADERLHCVITRTAELARRQAEDADRDLRRGIRRGPLHGVPWGCKDILDTAGIRTTWGAEPWQERIPERNAVVVDRLAAAGNPMVAKLSVGALAYGDVWFGGRTRNPWNTERGSSGSSAGSAAATAAGLVGFSIGTETFGSIVSPCMECGAVGLRPTFGRVARTGCMALCWSLDKIGPITRSVRDTALVLSIINGADDGDPASVTREFVGDPARGVEGLRLGILSGAFEGDRSGPLDRETRDGLRDAGAALVDVELPELPYEALLIPLFVEAAAAFEELTRADLDDQLTWQDDDAWPNTFRRTWLLPAIELVQADRFRREVMQAMHRTMSTVDALLTPSFAGGLGGPLLVTNATGHPSITVPTHLWNGRPHGITVIGRLFDEATVCRVGTAIEAAAPIRGSRPPTS